MKRYAVVLLATALILGTGAGISYAYLSGRDEAVNHFSAVSAEIEIHEDFTPPEEIIPGKIIKKIPVIKNTSGTPCYVRVSVRFSNGEALQNCEAVEIKNGWSRKEDGWYYWDEALLPDKSTGPVFEQIKIKDNVQEEITPFDILVYAEAVCCGEKSADEAWREMNQIQDRNGG
ncbi:MAG: hypothetical protein Q4F83_08830 [Eubacteriales bacterium]|nr:hypothetical protein [Eubacteriales bacterium]